ncbi:MAG: multiheme c-type cytochrome [Gammaproteobacteria bacterium]|nr:multiheme c-type cytochrome [Gammaproteobacteria bacterium]
MACALLALAAAGCGDAPAPAPPSAPAKAAEYVGSAACASCHEAQHEAWLGSHHQLAMSEPSPATLIGDFDGAVLHHGGGLTAFSKADGRYAIRTEGPTGERASFAVRYTFGFAPLQQYLLPLPDGRLQASNVAWDAVQGRWFHLRPGESIGHDDVLHWSQPSHNWNFMCADCHSTAVSKGYDAKARRYETTFSEVSVGCEACHGPGSAHAVPSAASARPALALPRDQADEINACAPCHSRRSQLAEGFAPQRSYFDHYSPALLDAGLYHADGQMLDEVYVYGSFLQSRMHAAGVTCGDCHEPHSAQLRAEGNALCIGCHNEVGNPNFPSLARGRYDGSQHHLHEPGSPGAQCVNCHMPARTYMVVDERRDHGFKVPRPDLNAATNAPDACTGCHQERDSAWAQAVLEEAFGPPSGDHFGPVFAAARTGIGEAEQPLAAIAGDAEQPAIVRATALSLMANYDRAVSGLALEAGLHDAHPLVRVGALRGAARWPAERRWREARHLLGDARLAVRAQAVPLLAPALNGLVGAGRTKLEAGIAEYLDVQAFNADRAEAQTNIGNLQWAIGAPARAEAAFAEALRLNAHWVPAMLNLADLYRATDRDVEAGTLLLRALSTTPESAEANLAKGLWLVRQGRDSEALVLFAAAVQLAPGVAQHAYVYAVALHSANQPERALEVLEQALSRRPNDQRLLRAAFGIARDLKLEEKAAAYRTRLD